MSTNTSVYVGPYLVCKMVMGEWTDSQRICSKNVKHEIDEEGMKFCAKCGGKIVVGEVREDRWRSFLDVECEELPRKLTPDEKLLCKKFRYVDPYYVGFKRSGYDILLPNTAKGFDADYEQVHEIKPKDFAKMLEAVDTKDLSLLLITMGYQSVEVKYGVLVHVA